MKLVSIVLAALLLAGCTMTTAGPFRGTPTESTGTATYINRETGETWFCSKNIVSYVPPVSVGYGSRGYPLCTKLLEWAGYERIPPTGEAERAERFRKAGRPWSVEWDHSCRYRIRSMRADQAEVEYSRCMAGE